jgi:cytochrome P450
VVYLREFPTHITLFHSLGGSDSTTQAVGVGILQLAQNPAIQEKLRAEVLSRPGVTFDDFSEKNMPYLDAVVRER